MKAGQHHPCKAKGCAVMDPTPTSVDRDFYYDCEDARRKRRFLKALGVMAAAAGVLALCLLAGCHGDGPKASESRPAGAKPIVLQKPSGPLSTCPDGSCDAPRAETVPTSRPASRPAGVDKAAFDAWATAKAQELSVRFRVPKPRTILMQERMPKTGEAVFPHVVVGIYMAGEYSRWSKTIRVWSLTGRHGDPVSDQDLRETWIHEWLHFLDHHNGVPSPKGDHNVIFDARAKAMGLNRDPR